MLFKALGLPIALLLLLLDEFIKGLELTNINDFGFVSLGICVSLGQSLHVGCKTLSHRVSHTFGHKRF